MARDYPLRVARSEIAYAVRRVPRGRRLKVRVDPERGVEVLLPAGRSAARGRRRGRRAARPGSSGSSPSARACARRLRRPGTVPYLDERLALVPQAGRTRAHRARRRAARARRRGRARPRSSAGTGAPRAPRSAAGSTARAPRAAGPTPRLTIRNQRTRWASCASGGAMSFNWRLLLAPARVLDYVVWHEVCHLEVADHSPRFWALLETRCPGWREPARLAARVRPRTGVVNHPLRSCGSPADACTVGVRCDADCSILVLCAAPRRAPLRRAGAARASRLVHGAARRPDRDLQRHAAAAATDSTSRPGPAGACRSAETTYTETDSYSWSYTLRRAARSAAQRRAGVARRQRPAQRDRAVGAVRRFRGDHDDLHPGAASADAGKRRRSRLSRRRRRRIRHAVTVGALGELLRTGAQPSCTGDGALCPTPCRASASCRRA